MARFSITQLEYLCAVAEAGTIAAAAERLSVSPTAVAAGLTALERSVGERLLVGRRAHGTTLTGAGRRFYEQAKRVVQAADEAWFSLAGEPDELVGPVAIGCYSTLAPTLLPAMAKHFARTHPRMTLSYGIGDQDRLVQSLRSGELDVAVVWDLYLPDGFHKTQLSMAAPYVMLGAEHRLSSQPSVELRDLADDPVVLFESPPASTHSMTIFRAAGVEPRITFRGTQYELIRSMVARNLGFSLMIHRPAHRYSYEGLEIVEMPISPAPPEERLVAIWPRESHLTHRAQAFVDAARAKLAGTLEV